mmetsp:Transcript_30253/g.68714  ORF Transcript_30253/g.68714 Transcript_30253/m.68714 type:complete len:200 (-) Transcript_30253:574-1173(-)
MGTMTSPTSEAMKVAFPTAMARCTRSSVGALKHPRTRRLARRNLLSCICSDVTIPTLTSIAAMATASQGSPPLPTSSVKPTPNVVIERFSATMVASSSIKRSKTSEIPFAPRRTAGKMNTQVQVGTCCDAPRRIMISTNMVSDQTKTTKTMTPLNSSVLNLTSRVPLSLLNLRYKRTHMVTPRAMRPPSADGKPPNGKG